MMSEVLFNKVMKAQDGKEENINATFCKDDTVFDHLSSNPGFHVRNLFGSPPETMTLELSCFSCR